MGTMCGTGFDAGRHAGIDAGKIPGMNPERKITVHVPEELLVRAQRASGQGVTETVRQGLRLLAAGDTFRRVAALRGKTRFSIDYARLRDDR
jgi:hypothetical protein